MTPGVDRLCVIGGGGGGEGAHHYISVGGECHSNGCYFVWNGCFITNNLGTESKYLSGKG